MSNDRPAVVAAVSPQALGIHDVNRRVPKPAVRADAASEAVLASLDAPLSKGTAKSKGGANSGTAGRKKPQLDDVENALFIVAVHGARAHIAKKSDRQNGIKQSWQRVVDDLSDRAEFKRYGKLTWTWCKTRYEELVAAKQQNDNKYSQRTGQDDEKVDKQLDEDLDDMIGETAVAQAKIDEELGLRQEKVQKQEMRAGKLLTASMTTAKKAPRVKPDPDGDSDSEVSSVSSGKRSKKAKKYVSESEQAMSNLFGTIEANSKIRVDQKQQLIDIENKKAEAALLAAQVQQQQMAFFMRMIANNMGGGFSGMMGGAHMMGADIMGGGHMMGGNHMMSGGFSGVKAAIDDLIPGFAGADAEQND